MAEDFIGDACFSNSFIGDQKKTGFLKVLLNYFFNPRNHTRAEKDPGRNMKSHFRLHSFSEIKRILIGHI